jgi:hypothetical protein
LLQRFLQKSLLQSLLQKFSLQRFLQKFSLQRLSWGIFTMYLGMSNAITYNLSKEVHHY